MNDNEMDIMSKANLFRETRKIVLDLITDDNVILVGIGTSGLKRQEMALKNNYDIEKLCTILKESIKN